MLDVSFVCISDDVCNCNVWCPQKQGINIYDSVKCYEQIHITYNMYVLQCFSFFVRIDKREGCN